MWANIKETIKVPTVELPSQKTSYPSRDVIKVINNDRTGGWINLTMSSSQYRKSHCGDKTILRSSYLHNGISYTGKVPFLYWIRALTIVTAWSCIPRYCTQHYTNTGRSLRLTNWWTNRWWLHYNDVIMSAMASQIISFMIVYSIVYSGADQKISNLRVTGLCVGNSPVTGEFPAQRASNAENVSIWWRHHGLSYVCWGKLIML